MGPIDGSQPTNYTRFMQYLFSLLFLLVPVVSQAQSALPPCPDSGIKHMCFGETMEFGVKYAGEFKNDKPNGYGTYTWPSGIKKVGEFKDGIPISVATLYPKITPANSAPDASRSERDRLVAEAESARKRQLELEEQLVQEKAEKERLAAQVALQNATQAQAQPGQVSRNERRLALVIGNGAYKVRPLNNPVNDANDISAALKRSGFQVIDVRNANLTQMRAKIREFGDQLISSDVGLVYYSGHGVELKGRNYLIPVNADIQREDEIADQGLDAGLILEKMNTAGKGVNILVVDACRDDPFGRSFRSTGRGLAQMDAPKGTIIAYSTSPGKVASDGDPKDRNSPYTKHLLRAMQIPNIPIEQVFKEVRRSVQAETKNQQTPWENTSLSGDFYFRVQR